MSKNAFNPKAFLKTEFEPRTAEIVLDVMKPFYPENTKPIFVVRGLTGKELTIINEITNKVDVKELAIQALTDKQAEIEKMREVLGINVDVPTELAKRIEQLIVGAVDPILDRDVVLKMVDVYPIEFFMLTNKIVSLTGLGMNVKKPSPSGKTPELEIP